MPTIYRTDALAGFSCLGDKCEDTCCQNWSMQVDDATFELYQTKAPNLLDAVVEEDGLRVMKKSPVTRFCVKLDGGQCNIHKQLGSGFLGDACHFYPRVTRSLGPTTLMTATLSCPEIARLWLLADRPAELQQADAERLPHTLKDYLPEGLSPQDALALHQLFLQATEDSNATPERIYARIAKAGRQLDSLPVGQWPIGAGIYLRSADAAQPIPDGNVLDPFNLLHALCGLIVASQKPASPRLQTTIAEMERALSVKLDWQNVTIDATNASASAYEGLKFTWSQHCAQRYNPVLRRWLQAQLSVGLFPFAGLGATVSERITIIGVRLATIKLALMCACDIYGGELPPEVLIRVIQSLSRFMDHLGDAKFSLMIYTETGWTQEGRLRGLLEC